MAPGLWFTDLVVSASLSLTPAWIKTIVDAHTMLPA
jgi:hypothetical protein